MSRRRHLRPGFTLVELGVTLAVAGIMTYLAVGMMKGVFVQSRVNSETRMLLGVLSRARVRAVAMNIPVGVYIGRATGTAKASTTDEIIVFYDNVATGATTPGVFGDDDVIIDGPRMLPLDGAGGQTVVRGPPLASTAPLPGAPSDDPSNGVSIIFNNFGLPSVSGANSLPLTLSLAQSGEPNTTRTVLLRSSGVATIQ